MAQALKEQERQEIAAAPGRDKFFFGGSDFLIESEDPVLKKEARGRLRIYRDLERDAKVYACLQRRYDMVVNAETRVVKAPRRTFSRKEDDRMRDMVDYQIKSMGVTIEDDMVNAHAEFASDFAGAQYGLLDACLLGYAVGEVMWDTDGREIYVREIRIRKQERFKSDNEFRWRLIDNQEFLRGRLLPRRKFLFYTFGSHFDPYGLSLGNRLYWPVWFKRKGVSFWLTFLDKYGGPTAVGRYPEGTEDYKQDLLLEAARSIHTDHAVVIPEQLALELLQSITTAAQQGYDQIAKFLDGQISQAILGVTLTTDVSGSQGSRAASEVHMHGERGVGQRDATFLMNYLNSTLTRWITDYNSGEDTPAPRLVKMFPHYDALREQVAIDQILNNQGYRRKLESVNELYGLGEDVFEKHEPKIMAPASPEREDQGEPDTEDEQEESQQLSR